MTFSEANQVVHPVETQWHYKYLTKYGFEPITKEGIGFVRSYEYQNNKGHKIRCTTGSNADYWSDETTKQHGGYWASLEPHLEEITK